MAEQPSFERLADDVFAFVQPPGGWCLNNAGLVTGASPVLIDTAATERRARLLQAEVEQVAPGGPEAVVNTHFHGDHVFGNALFAPFAQIVAHADTRADVIEAGHGLCGLWPDVEWGGLPLAPPTMTFEGRAVLHTGGPAVELIHVGPAHTRGDVAAWIPERGVLFTGDVVWSGVTPFVLMGSVEGSLAAIERLGALGATTVVPGHGRVGGPELLDQTAAYLRWLRDTAVAGRRAGRDPLEAARAAGLGGYATLLDSERLAANLCRAYAELDGLAPGADLDVLSAFRSMVEFHGGLPACHA
jgi:cyclase